VVHRLNRLRHDAVVSRHDEHDDVGHLRAPGAHGGERLVARRVEKNDLPLGRAHVVGADVLGDPPRLARGHVGRSNRVQERRLPVVHVPHHRHDRRTVHEVLGAIDGPGREEAFHLHLDVLDLVAELVRHERCRVGVDHRVDVHHHPQAHELA
jgi:hypothetical protein